MILLACLVLFVAYIITGLPNLQGDALVIISFLINGVLISIELMMPTKKGYSLKETVFVFALIFLFISPLVQYLSGNFPWMQWEQGESLITEDRLVQANVLVSLFIIVYSSFYRWIITRKRGEEIANTFIKNERLTLDIFFVLTLLSSALSIYLIGFENLFSRATNVIDVDSSALSLIIRNTGQSISVIYVALNILYRRKKGKWHRVLPFIIGLALMILVNFPTGGARFWTGVVYLGLFLVIFPKIRQPHLVKILLVLGLIVVLPFLDIFRSQTLASFQWNQFNLLAISDYLQTGHFDSYSMLTRAIAYTDEFGIQPGHNLLGVALFFIPRSIWPDKPIGSGAMVANAYNWPFNNVSMNFIGEGYINFGLLGVILFALVFAWITARADHSFQNMSLEGERIAFRELVYPFSIGFIFFIMRGDLMSSYSYFIGFMVPVIVLYLFNRIKVK